MKAGFAKQVDATLMTQWAQQCLQHCGASEKVAAAMAQQLVLGDLLGFRTHGLLRLRYNLNELVAGRTKAEGNPRVIAERAAVATWDAELLSGLYVLPQAVATAVAKARDYGTGTVVVRRAQHVASLACYLEAATDAGMLITMMASTPGQSVVAPFGAKQAVFSPNPFAIGVPTQSEPILLDISLSMTAAGKVRAAIAEQRELPYPALITPTGEYTTDATTFTGTPPSVLACLGGEQLGYKGSGLTLFSELWTMALSNYGRAQGLADSDANSVFIQVLDPAAFGDKTAFLAESQAQVEALQRATPIDPQQPVRVPGQQALAAKREQLANGIYYSEAVWRQLEKCAAQCEIALPAA